MILKIVDDHAHLEPLARVARPETSQLGAAVLAKYTGRSKIGVNYH